MVRSKNKKSHSKKKDKSTALLCSPDHEYTINLNLDYIVRELEAAKANNDGKIPYGGISDMYKKMKPALPWLTRDMIKYRLRKLNILPSYDGNNNEALLEHGGNDKALPLHGGNDEESNRTSPSSLSLISHFDGWLRLRVKKTVITIMTRKDSNLTPFRHYQVCHSFAECDDNNCTDPNTGSSTAYTT
jgi:hypothetical protein